MACLSGTAFGAYGEGYLRFSVANSLENLNKALDRIDEWTKKNHRGDGRMRGQSDEPVACRSGWRPAELWLCSEADPFRKSRVPE